MEHDAALAAEAGGGPPAGPGPSGHDPGAGARRAAEGLAEDLGADLEAAERAVEQRLRQAAADAPDEPGLWDQAFRFGKEFVSGAVEATVGLGEFVFKLTPTYALIDPEGYVEHLVGLGQGVAYGVTHPVEFAQAVTNWDLWLDNPARALGQLVPDLVLGVGTAGAGTAATAASRAARGVEKLDDVADGARAAERLAGGTTDVRRGAEVPATRFTGGRSADEWDGILAQIRDPDSLRAYELRTRYADDFYDAVRNGHRADDIQRISRSSGMSPDDVGRIRDHVFTQEHDLGERVARFDSNPDMADAWRRLQEGRPEPSDLSLLHHELAEADWIRDHPGVTYPDAHAAVVEQGYTWEPPEWRPLR